MEKKYVLLARDEMDYLEEGVDEFFILNKKEMCDRVNQFINAECEDEETFAEEYAVFEKVGEEWVEIDYKKFL